MMEIDPMHVKKAPPAPEPMPRWKTLAELVNKGSWERGAELGVYDGRTSLYLMQHCPGLHTLYAVDTWGSVELPLRKSSRERCECIHCKATRKVRFRLKKRGGTVKTLEEELRLQARVYTERLDLIKNTTVAAAENIFDGELDFIFLDAGHDTQSVDEDLTAWLPKLRDGGWLIGHDWHFKSVRAGVAKHFPLKRVGIVPEDHVWSIRVWRKKESESAGG